MKSMLPSLLVGVALSAACSAPNSGDDAATQSDATRSDTATTDTGSSTPDSSPSVDSGQPDVAAQTDTGPTPDASADEHPTTLSTKQCFFFATGMATLDNPCHGELFTLEGAMVDLGTGGGSNSGMGGLCEQPGTYPDLASVPHDYSACTWSEYVEGGGGLANHGILVRSMDNLHHYRMWIQSNALPNLVFRWDMID